MRLTEAQVEEVHTIKNMLAGVIWTAQVMLAEEGRSDTDHEDLSNLIRASREIVRRVTDLADS